MASYPSPPAEYSDESDGGGDEMDMPTDPAGMFEAMLAYGIPVESMALVMEQLGSYHCKNCTQLNQQEDEVCKECGYAGGEFDNLPDNPVPANPKLPRARRTGYVYDTRCLEHSDANRANVFDLHVERPDRARVIMNALCQHGVASRCLRVPSRPATRDEVLSVHTADYLRSLEVEWADEPHANNDTYVRGPRTKVAALLAAGGVLEATQQVMAGQLRNAFAVVRPPGHHAESDQCMGFCFINNVAVAAQQAKLTMGARRVLIVDWDVHHGNGTEHIFEDDPQIMYASLHRYDGGRFYPGTGAATDIGVGAGTGFNVNVPWPHSVGDAEYVAAFHHLLLPLFTQFRPDLVLVSAGFDSAHGDPLGGCHVTPNCFAFMTAALAQLSAGRIVVALEGGYNLRSISESALACVRALLGDPLPRMDLELAPAPRAMQAISEARRALAPWWSMLRTWEVQQAMLDDPPSPPASPLSPASPPLSPASPPLSAPAPAAAAAAAVAEASVPAAAPVRAPAPTSGDSEESDEPAEPAGPRGRAMSLDEPPPPPPPVRHRRRRSQSFATASRRRKQRSWTGDRHVLRWRWHTRSPGADASPAPKRARPLGAPAATSAAK